MKTGDRGFIVLAAASLAGQAIIAEEEGYETAFIPEFIHPTPAAAISEIYARRALLSSDDPDPNLVLEMEVTGALDERGCYPLSLVRVDCAVEGDQPITDQDTPEAQ